MQTATLINPYFDFEQQNVINKKFQPLCLGYIASLIRYKVRVRIIDANALQIKSQDLVIPESDYYIINTADIDRWQCPIIDLTPVYTLIDKIKKVSNNPKIFIIGPHGTVDSSQFKDVVVIQNAPEIQVAEAILGFKPINDYTEMPIPAYDLMPMELYDYDVMGRPFSLMESTRGCPFNCIFCSKVMFPKTYSIRDLGIVIDEIKYLVKNFGVKYIWFIDLEFCTDKNRVIDFCNRLISQNIKVKWCIQSRVDTVNPKLLETMKRAGCDIIQFGVESGVQEIIDKANKKITIEQVTKTFKECNRLGIKTVAYFTIGNFGESREQVMQTIRFAKRLNPWYASFNIVVSRKGATLSEKTGQDEYQTIYSNGLNHDELKTLRRKAILSFYLRPAYILKRLYYLRTVNDWLILWRAFRNYFLPVFKR